MSHLIQKITISSSGLTNATNYKWKPGSGRGIRKRDTSSEKSPGIRSRVAWRSGRGRGKVGGNEESKVTDKLKNISNNTMNTLSNSTEEDSFDKIYDEITKATYDEYEEHNGGCIDFNVAEDVDDCDSNNVDNEINNTYNSHPTYYAESGASSEASYSGSANPQDANCYNREDSAGSSEASYNGTRSKPREKYQPIYNVRSCLTNNYSDENCFRSGGSERRDNKRVQNANGRQRSESGGQNHGQRMGGNNHRSYSENYDNYEERRGESRSRGGRNFYRSTAPTRDYEHKDDEEYQPYSDHKHRGSSWHRGGTRGGKQQSDENYQSNRPRGRGGYQYRGRGNNYIPRGEHREDSYYRPRGDKYKVRGRNEKYPKNHQYEKRNDHDSNYNKYEKNIQHGYNPNRQNRRYDDINDEEQMYPQYQSRTFFKKRYGSDRNSYRNGNYHQS